MNGQRTVRKYIERLSSKDLQGLYQEALTDNSQEALVIIHLIKCELRKRK